MSARVYWVRVSEEFGTAHEYGCCAAFVDGTVCGWPRLADGTCRAGHPAQPASAPTFAIRDLLATVRVLGSEGVSS